MKSKAYVDGVQWLVLHPTLVIFLYTCTFFCTTLQVDITFFCTTFSAMVTLFCTSVRIMCHIAAR